MPCADQVPVKNPHSITMRWHKWVVLIAGSTGSALRAVRSSNLYITLDVAGLATTIGRGERAWGAGLVRRFYGLSVLRRRHSGRLSHRSWLALPVLIMVWGCAWGRGQGAAVWRVGGKALPFGAARGAIMGNVVY